MHELHAATSIKDFPAVMLRIVASLVVAEQTSFEVFSDPERFQSLATPLDHPLVQPPASSDVILPAAFEANTTETPPPSLNAQFPTTVTGTTKPQFPFEPERKRQAPNGRTTITPNISTRRNIEKHYEMLSHPERREIQTFLPRLVATIHTHPLFGHYQTAGEAPRMISDVASLQEFRDTAVYQQFYGRIGVCRELLLFLQNQGFTRIGVSLSRDGRNFSERDRNVLAFLSPHLTQAYRHARLASDLAGVLDDLGEGLAELDRGVILVGINGHIRWLNPLARVWLETLLPSDTDSSKRLPKPLADGFSEFQKAATSPGGRRACFEHRMEGKTGSQLIARFGNDGSKACLIILRRERTGLDPFVAVHFGLTRREEQILFWISEGKSNPDLAGILEVSLRTIHKHVEHLFTKLGVESRCAAQRLGAEFRRD